MFIIEGADCLGKTTAAKKIERIHEEEQNYEAGVNHEMCGVPQADRPDITYKHMGRPDEETFDFFNDYTPMMDSFSVQDRFHLGGIIWHKDKITAASLKIIEGRLLARGAFIVIMYCSDYRWYMNKLENDDRGNMFDPIRIAEANQQYHIMIQGGHELNPYFDVAWDIKKKEGSVLYPGQNVLQYWYSLWIERISKL